MKPLFAKLAIFFCCGVIFYGCSVAAATKPPRTGELMPAVELPVPKSDVWRHYLGINREAGRFALQDIDADILVIEIFSMYCPYCQREAPQVNHLYDIITMTPELKDRVKIIGIGASNSTYEVNFFKDQYKVPFPLFPDPDLSIHRKLGSVRTPYFFVIRRLADGTRKIIYSKVGSIGEPQLFLDKVTRKVGR